MFKIEVMMKELSIEEKAKAYDEVREKIALRFGSNVAEELFSKFEMSEDESMVKFIKKQLFDIKKTITENYELDAKLTKAIEWLEKQGDINETIDRDKFAQGVLKGAAINLITWIDYNAAEGNICLSNMECKDIQDALVSGNWNKIYAYIKKKLERQGEQKSILCDGCVNRKGCINCENGDAKETEYNGESKFRVGCWIVNNDSKDVFLIKSINNGYCTLEDVKGNIISPCLPPPESDFHLWTIADAKDGDVLAFNNDIIVIFKDLYNSSTFHSYCHIEDGILALSKDDMPDWWEGKEFQPATKEQRDTLFAKMEEAGYEFDFKDKELRKIEKQVPKWSEEDEKNRCNLMSTLSNLRHRAIKEETFQRYYTWLKTLKNGRKIIKQQEPSWAKTSEECKHDALEKGEELRKWLDFAKTHEGTTITIPKDLKGTDTDGGVVGEKGEQGEQFTEEEMVGMGGLGKVWKEQAIINKLDKIIELLQSAILVLPKEPYVPPIIYKRPLDPDPNVLGGWATTASTEGGGE